MTEIKDNLAPTSSQKAKLPPLAYLMCGWPLLLVAIGGAIGGCLGGAAFGVNLGGCWAMEADHDLTAIMKRQAKSIRTRTDPPADLTGRRFGKWTVLKYAGQKIRCYRGQNFSTRMWLCRCDCGVQKEVPHYNLTKGHSKKCQQCFRTRHGISSTKLYERWRRLRKSGELPKEWKDFNVFAKAVGDPPEKGASLTRYNRTKPYSAENVFWMSPVLLKNDPTLLAAHKQRRRKSMEEQVAHDGRLMQIRTAKSFKERNRHMIAARKTGYTLSLIATAANVTIQRAQAIVATRCR